MKKITIKTMLMCGILSSLNFSYAQKDNEVNAAMEFQSFQKSLMSENYEDAKKALMDAKKYIDEAAANEETVHSPKTLFYKGQIYLTLPVLSSMMPDDQELKTLASQKTMEDGVESLKQAYKLDDRNRYRGDIETFAQMGRVQAINAGVEGFNQNDFKTAKEMFETSIAMQDILGLTDSVAYYNAGLAADRLNEKEDAIKYYKKCAEIGYNTPVVNVLASGLLRQLKRDDEAKEIVASGLKNFPTDKSLILEMVNINLGMGNTLAAEKSLTDAIASDPTNKQLYLNIGLVHESLANNDSTGNGKDPAYRKEQNDKAVDAFKKAIELDPNYEDAVYSLGAHYVGLGIEGKEVAEKLPFGDASYDGIIKESDGYYQQAIPYLEKASELDPTNKQILDTLYKLFAKMGNSEKSAAYKAKLEALK